MLPVVAVVVGWELALALVFVVLRVHLVPLLLNNNRIDARCCGTAEGGDRGQADAEPGSGRRRRGVQPGPHHRGEDLCGKLTACHLARGSLSARPPIHPPTHPSALLPHAPPPTKCSGRFFALPPLHSGVLEERGLGWG